MLEISIHLVIGAVSWVIGSLFLEQKLRNVLLSVVAAQALYALFHYPIAAESALRAEGCIVVLCGRFKSQPSIQS